MRSIDPGISRFRVWATRIPECPRETLSLATFASSSPKSFSTPFDQLGADLLRLLLLRPMAAAAHQIFLQIGDELLHAVGGRWRQHRIVLGHDHQRRDVHMMIEPFRALPVARKVAVPVDAAGEAGFREGIDEHLLFLWRQDRRARIVFGVVIRDHLWKRQIESWRGADTCDRLFLRGPFGACYRLAHERIEGLFDAASENPVRLAAGVLELHDVHLVAEALAKQLDRIGRCAIPMRRVDSYDAGDAVDVTQRHLPDDEATPIVADEDRL